MTAVPPPPPDAPDQPLSYADRILDRLVTTAQLRDMPPPQPLIDGWLNLDSLAMIYGPSGAGKSHVAMDIAHAVTTRDWWHANTVHNGIVLYVVAEGTPGARVRAAAWEEYHGVNSGVLWHPGAVNVFDANWASGLADAVAQLEPVLVVIDTFARSIIGADENSTRDVSISIDHLDRIRSAARCCVLIVHHAGKDIAKGARGASALKAAMDTEIEVVGTEGRITVRNTKQKDSAESPPLHFKLVPVGDTKSVVIAQAGKVDPEDLPDAAWETLAALRLVDVPEGVAATVWRAAVDVPERTFYRHRSGLLAQGHVVNVGTDGRPRYRPADAGGDLDD